MSVIHPTGGLNMLKSKAKAKFYTELTYISIYKQWATAI